MVRFNGRQIFSKFFCVNDRVDKLKREVTKWADVGLENLVIYIFNEHEFVKTFARRRGANYISCFNNLVSLAERWTNVGKD